MIRGGRGRRRPPACRPAGGVFTTATLVLALCAVPPSAAAPTVANSIDEAGLGGVRSLAGATITIAGADWAVSSPSAKAQLEGALAGMTGVYPGCGVCPDTPVNPGGWVCTFFNPSGAGASAVPARTECRTSNELFDIFSTARYTLASWSDDAGNTYTDTTFDIVESKGDARVVADLTGVTGPSTFPPATQTITEPADGAYPGGTVTVPSLIFTELEMRAGTVSAVVALLGESWNDRTNVYKSNIVGWVDEIDFNSVVNPGSSINPRGWATYKSMILTEISYSFASNFHAAQYMELDTATVAFGASPYDISEHEVIQISITDEAVQSVPPSAGQPESPDIAFEIWPTGGVVATAPSPVSFTEDQIRAGGATFDIVITGDEWVGAAYDWEKVRTGLISDVTTGEEAKGFNARRATLLSMASSITRVDASTLRVTLAADPDYDTSITETIGLGLSGCASYRRIRVLAVGQECTPNYITTSQLIPDTSGVTFTITPGQGVLTIAPTGSMTECDFRMGFDIELTLENDYWNYNNMDAARTLLYDIITSNLDAMMAPAGFTALKSTLIRGPVTPGGPPAGVLVSFDNRVMTVTIGPTSSYDLTTASETIDVAAAITGMPSPAGTLFRSGGFPMIVGGGGSAITVTPGPCTALTVTSGCVAGSLCGTGFACPQCGVFDEVDVRMGAAVITLTLGTGEQWTDPFTANPGAVWDLTFTGDAGWSTADTASAASMATAAQYPNGFLARWDLDDGSAPPSFLTATRVSDQVLQLTFNDAAYSAGVSEKVSFTIPPAWVASGLVDPTWNFEFTINPVQPALTTVLTPDPLVLWTCEIQGPAYIYAPTFTGTPVGQGWSLVAAMNQCGSVDTPLGTGVADEQACAQLCHESPACEFFIFGTAGGGNDGVCRAEPTADAMCPEGLVADNDWSFYRLTTRGLGMALTLDPGAWTYATPEEFRVGFTPTTSAFYTSIATLIPDANIVYSDASGFTGNVLTATIAADPTFALAGGALEEMITFTVAQGATQCNCGASPSTVALTVKACPGVVDTVPYAFTEVDIWAGNATMEWQITGDAWKTGIALDDFIASFAIAGTSVPTAGWAAQTRDCVFKTPPVVNGANLSITLGPCPEFDINTDAMGALSGTFAPVDAGTVYSTISGATFTVSGLNPVGGTLSAHPTYAMLHNPDLEAKVSVDLKSSPGVVRVVPNDVFNEKGVRAGTYGFTLVLDNGETFANPNAQVLVTYIRDNTASLNTVAVGQGWEFLSTVLVDTVAIDATDPHKLRVDWTSNTNYNIFASDAFCVTIGADLTASGLPPIADDGTTCVKPEPIIPINGCVSMVEYPLTFTEDQIRTTGFEFTLVLDQRERWSPTNLDALIQNMTVAAPSPARSTFGFDARKGIYSSAAFILDATGSTLRVRFPGTPMGELAPDPNFDIVEEERVEFRVPGSLIGSTEPTCILSPAGGPLTFTITPIRGTVSMVNAEYTEADIRTLGASLVLELLNDTWTAPWTATEKDLIRNGMVSACGYTDFPALADIPAFVARTLAFGGAPTPCGYATGFDGLRSRVVDPLVGTGFLQYNNERLQIPVGPLVEYDTGADELVIITLAPGVIASGTVPDGADTLWFVIRAGKVRIDNDPFVDAAGATITGLQEPGIPEGLIRAGTAPQIRIRLTNETWDIAEAARIAPGFCGAGGNCSDVTTHPAGFNKYRSTFFDANVVFENDLGAVCPPACPATVAVLTIAPQPGFDVCNNAMEGVVLTLDPLTVESKPGTPPTNDGNYTLGFNITGDAGTESVNITVDAGGEAVTEASIRRGGVTVTITLFDGRWNEADPNFAGLLRDSIASNLPAGENFSHAGTLRAALLPASNAELTFADALGGHAVSFRLEDPQYDIASETPKGCTPVDCYWVPPNLASPTDYICRDGTRCSLAVDGRECCATRGGTERCPATIPYMCAWAVCNNDHCCVDSADMCDYLGYGGVRQCDLTCVANETLTVNLAPELSRCSVVTPVYIDIGGESWSAHWFQATTATYEADASSQVVGLPFDVIVEGNELHSLADTAGVSLVDVGCSPPVVPVQSMGATTPAVPVAYPLNAMTVAPTTPGPGLYAVRLPSINVSTPGIYSVCYKDFRDAAFIAVPTTSVTTTGAPTDPRGPAITVMGRAFSFGGGEVTVTVDGRNATEMKANGIKTVLRVEGEGLCVGTDASTGIFEARPYAHDNATLGGCDSVKIMVGDVPCDPDAAGVYDDGNGRMGDAVGLMPADGDADGAPRTRGDAYVDLYFRGNHSVCYMSKWSRRWVKVGVIEVIPSVDAWSACDPNDANSLIDREYYSPTHGDVTTPYSPAPLVPCSANTTAWPRKPHRLYFNGVGLSSSGDVLGSRTRRRRYEEIGVGVCFPSDANFAPLAKCYINATRFGARQTLEECQALCDATALCDGVEFDQQGIRCGLVMQAKISADTGNPFPIFTDDRTYCEPNPYNNVRPLGTLGAIVDPVYPGSRCYARIADDEIATDVGDEAKVIRFNESCTTSDGVPDGVLNASTPAVQYVKGDPNGAMWGNDGRACNAFAAADRECQTTTTHVEWTFREFGRFALCYRIAGVANWTQLPGVLSVTAAMVDVSPPHLWASPMPPVVYHYGRGIEDLGVWTRLREWPAGCAGGVANPGILGTGWADGVYLPPGGPLDGSLIPDTDATWLPDPAGLLEGYHGVNRTAWFFNGTGVAGASGAAPPPAPPTPAPRDQSQDVLLTQWWSQTGEYSFCAHLPWLFDDGVYEGPYGRVQVEPVVTGFTPVSAWAAPTPTALTVDGFGFDTRAGRDRVKFVPAVLGTCDDHPGSGEPFGDRVVYGDALGPSSGGVGGIGTGVRGIVELTTKDAVFAAAGVYRVCHGYIDNALYRTGAVDRRCSAYSTCNYFRGDPSRNCCPNEEGAFETCCEQDAAVVWREVPPNTTAATAGPSPQQRARQQRRDASCVVDTYFLPQPTDPDPPAWSFSDTGSTYIPDLPLWYPAAANCLNDADLLVYTARAPWNEPAYTTPPCPAWYCGGLHIYPLVGAMIVLDHKTLEDPPVLEAGLPYTLRFDGQGFSIGDYVFVETGLLDDCKGLDPTTAVLTVQAAAYAGDPGTPWAGPAAGLPRAVADVSLDAPGDYTVCLSFQLFPGLYMRAGNFTVRPSTAEMAWDATPDGDLLISFYGVALNSGVDAARLLPSTSFINCTGGNHIVNGTGAPLANIVNGTQWIVTTDTLAYGAYVTCYRMGGTGEWQLLKGEIDYPFANIPPAFNVSREPTEWGPVDDMLIYGGRGRGLGVDAEYAVRMSTAVDADGVRVDNLPAEARQTLFFEISYVAGGPALFTGACHSPRRGCYAGDLLNATACVAAGCSWEGAPKVCAPPDLALCDALTTNDTCEALGCVWAPGAPPAIDPDTGVLSFSVGDVVAAAGTNGTEVLLDVLLRDSGGTARGGRDTFFPPQRIRIRFVPGLRITPIDPPIISFVEDEPAGPVMLFTDITTRVGAAAGNVRYTLHFFDDAVRAMYFAGGVEVTPEGSLRAYLSPDRWIAPPGVPIRVVVTDDAADFAAYADFNISIVAVNDPPYLKYAPEYAGNPEIWWTGGRTAPFSARVVDVLPTAAVAPALAVPANATLRCRTIQVTHCARVYMTRGCRGAGFSGGALDIPQGIGYDCNGVDDCLAAACATSGNPGSVAAGVVASCSALTPTERACVERQAIVSECSATTLPVECGEVGAVCLRAVCAALPPTTLSLGNFEPQQDTAALTATVGAQDINYFSLLPAISAEGVLTFAISPSASIAGDVPVNITIRDTGGTQFGYGGADTYTIPTPLVIRTLRLPQLFVDPPTGGVALSTTWRMAAVRDAAADEAPASVKVAWRYTFTTILHTSGGSGATATNASAASDVYSTEVETIGHSLYGPDGTGEVFTTSLPPGRHTVVMQIFEDGVFVGEVRGPVTVDRAPDATVASVLQAGVAMAEVGQGGEALPMLAGAADAMRAIAGAEGGIEHLVSGVLAAVENLKARAVQPNEGLHEDVVYTALSALRSAVAGRQLLPAALLRVAEAYDAVRTIPAAAAAVTSNAYLTLTGVSPGVLPSLQGAGYALAPPVVAALQGDLAAALGVDPSAVTVDPLVMIPPGTPDRVAVNYSVDGFDNAAALRGIANLQLFETQATMRALRDAAEAAASDTTRVDYAASQATSTASARVVFPGLDITDPALTGAFDLNAVADAMLGDFATNVGVPRSDVVGRLVASATAGGAAAAALEVTVNTDAAPQASANIACAMALACMERTLLFPSAPAFPPDLAGSALEFMAAGVLRLVGVDASRVEGGVNRDALVAAVTADLAAVHGVDPAAVRVRVAPAAGGRVEAVYTIDSFASATRPAVQQQAVEKALSEGALRMLRAHGVLAGLPTAMVAVDADPKRSGVSDMSRRLTLTETMVDHFVETAGAVVSAAPAGPAVWRTRADADAVSRNATARANLNIAVDQQLRGLHAVLEAHCRSTLIPAARAAGEYNGSPRSHTTDLLTVSWSAALAPPPSTPTSVNTVAATPLEAQLALANGETVAVSGDRPAGDTCFVVVGYTRPPYLSDGEPGVAPLAPVVSVVGPQPGVTATVSTSGSGGATVAPVYWNTDAMQWRGLESSKGALEVRSVGTASIMWKEPTAATAGARGAAALSLNAAPPLPAGIRIMAAAVEADDHGVGTCFPCVVLPCVIVPWVLIVLISACLLERSGRRLFARMNPPLTTDAAKIRHAAVRPPTCGSVLVKHHAHLACGMAAPSLYNFYTRAERVTVVFSVYFIAIGVLSLFYDPDAVGPWETEPDFKPGEGMAIAILSLLVAWIPSLGLRRLLAARELSWRCHVAEAGVVHIPEELQASNLDDTGLVPRRSGLRWVYYTFVAAGCIVMCVIHYMYTVDYNTEGQMVNWLFAFAMVIVFHFILEFVWLLVMQLFERSYWNSQSHPRHVVAPELKNDEPRREHQMAKIPVEDENEDALGDDDVIATLLKDPPEPATPQPPESVHKLHGFSPASTTPPIGDCATAARAPMTSSTPAAGAYASGTESETPAQGDFFMGLLRDFPQPAQVSPQTAAGSSSSSPVVYQGAGVQQPYTFARAMVAGGGSPYTAGASISGSPARIHGGGGGGGPHGDVDWSRVYSEQQKGGLSQAGTGVMSGKAWGAGAVLTSSAPTTPVTGGGLANPIAPPQFPPNGSGGGGGAGGGALVVSPSSGRHRNMQPTSGGASAARPAVAGRGRGKVDPRDSVIDVSRTNTDGRLIRRASSGLGRYANPDPSQADAASAPPGLRRLHSDRDAKSPAPSGAVTPPGHYHI